MAAWKKVESSGPGRSPVTTPGKSHSSTLTMESSLVRTVTVLKSGARVVDVCGCQQGYSLVGREWKLTGTNKLLVRRLKKAVLPAFTSPMRQILMVRVATRVEGAPAVAAVLEPTRERKSKGEKDRETGEAMGVSRGVSAAMGLAAASVASGEKVGEKASVGLVCGLVLSAPRRLAREKVRWKAAPTRLRLVVCWSASAISSSLVGWVESQLRTWSVKKLTAQTSSTNNRTPGSRQSHHGISMTRLPSAEQFQKPNPRPKAVPRKIQSGGETLNLPRFACRQPEPPFRYRRQCFHPSRHRSSRSNRPRPPRARATASGASPACRPCQLRACFCLPFGVIVFERKAIV